MTGQSEGLGRIESRHEAPPERPAAGWAMRAGGDRIVVVLFAALALAGLAAPVWFLSITTVTLARALAVLGLLLLLRGGLVSFGHGLYYCLGGYAVGLLDGQGVGDVVLRVLLAGLVGGAVAVPVGLLLRRYRGLFFAMLSLAFSMLLYGLLVKSQSLGSTDGFNVLSSSFFGTVHAGEALQHRLFLFTVLVALACYLAVSHHLRTVMGALMPAMKDNEIRIEYLGHSALRLVHGQYVIGAVLTGMAGAIVAVTVGHVDPEMAYWTTSGDFVFITILGGSAHPLAAFLGAAVFEVIHTVALWVAPDCWRLILGFALLLLIVWLPNGLWSLFGRRS